MHQFPRYLFLLALLVIAPAVLAADRPNIVFVVSEDNSKHYLKLYDEHGAETPNIAKLAAHGLIFDHAFSNAPVCSAARTTLATSVYGPRVATHYHRKLAKVTMPTGWKLFQEYLQDAGYYATNNSKTDYNVDAKTTRVWDACSRKASWKNREKGQPFFHMESHGVSHESSLHFSRGNYEKQKTKTDPKSVTVWPYFPQTDLFRYTTARYHDRMKDVDNIVGRVVADLKKAGVLDDTFIFYFGDHGGVLPASKGYAWERGLHVPLVVYVPDNFRHLVDEAMKPGTRVQGFVEFIDFGPTALHLAGLDVPAHMDGEPFLGKGVTLAELNQRDETFGYADRFDEKYEHVRTLRKGKWKYVRFYQGYYPDGLQNNYRYKMLGYQEWRQLYRAGKLNAEQAQFFEPKPAEGLYDIEADPHELNNLADDPQHAATVKMLRQRLREYVTELPDLSMYPESVLVDEAVGQPLAFGKSHKAEIARLVDVADLALLPFSEAEPKLRSALKSDNPWVRYWAATSCAVFGDAAGPLASDAKPLLTDDHLMVRVRAAEFLGRARAADPVPAIMSVLKESDSHVEALIALNAVVYLRDALGYEFDITKKDIRSTGGQVSRRIEYLTK